MAKPDRAKKMRGGGSAGAGARAPVYSPQAQELRALLRRVPDGFQATLNALAARSAEERDRLMGELARGMGKESLPLIRAAALGADDGLSHSALRVLPVFGTRAAGDVLVEAFQKHPEGERARLARQGALALQARGIHVAVPEPAGPEAPPRLTLRETLVSVPDGVGSHSVAARLQDGYGVWYSILILWNDQVGVKDGFMRPMSRQEWAERMERAADRGLCWTPCPPDYARWQIERGRSLNERSGLPLSDFLKDWDQWVGPPPASYEPPDPTASVRAAGSAELSEWVTGSQDLFELPDTRRWFLEAADCVEESRRWMELQTRLRLRGESEALTQELVEVLQATVERMIDARQQELYRERLLELSRVYGWRPPSPGGSLAARRAAAVVVAMEQGMPARDNPFFIALAQRTLQAAEALLRGGEDPERSRYRPHRRY